MATQKSQIRQRLGAEVARIRLRLDMKTQADLAKAAGLSLRSVWAVESGEKVAPRTLKKIEAALKLAPGVIDEFLDGRIRELPMIHSKSPAVTSARTEILLASRDELLNMAARVAEVRGEAEAERWLIGALEMRQAAGPESQTQSATERDVS